MVLSYSYPQEIVFEERKPLAVTAPARRLDRVEIPAQPRPGIRPRFISWQKRPVRAKELVLAEWQKTLSSENDIAGKRAAGCSMS